MISTPVLFSSVHEAATFHPLVFPFFCFLVMKQIFVLD